MNRQKLSQQVVWATLITLLLFGCGAPAATPTPTPEPSPEPVIELGDVTFDGTDCIVNVPAELPPGRYSIVFYDDVNELDANMWISRLVDGKTFQDALDLQAEPGDYVPEQDWLVNAIETETARYRPDDGEVHTYRFISEGEYLIGVWAYEEPTTPWYIWFCAPFWVKEALSE